MQPKFGQILTAREVSRAALTNKVTALLAQGVSVEDVLLDVRDGLVASGLDPEIALASFRAPREALDLS